MKVTKLINHSPVELDLHAFDESALLILPYVSKQPSLSIRHIEAIETEDEVAGFKVAKD